MKDLVALAKNRKSGDKLTHAQLRALAEKHGLKFATVRSRYVRGHRGDKLVAPIRPSFQARCEAHGIAPKTVYYRMSQLGMTEEEALTTPLRGGLVRQAVANGLSPDTFYRRRKLGYPIKRCLDPRPITYSESKRLRK
ncbi:hypothetical protein [Celeribacter sp.]|uniref:hypothetical protein n=1 Tax=Celeribacter sp. TaxID=1890673 RepID=UPI003A8F5011